MSETDETEELLKGDDPRHMKITSLVEGFFLAAGIMEAESPLVLTAAAVVLARFVYQLGVEEKKLFWNFVHNTTEQNALLIQKSEAGSIN